MRCPRCEHWPEDRAISPREFDPFLSEAKRRFRQRVEPVDLDVGGFLVNELRGATAFQCQAQAMVGTAVCDCGGMWAQRFELAAMPPPNMRRRIVDFFIPVLDDDEIIEPALVLEDLFWDLCLRVLTLRRDRRALVRPD